MVMRKQTVSALYVNISRYDERYLYTIYTSLTALGHGHLLRCWKFSKVSFWKWVYFSENRKYRQRIIFLWKISEILYVNEMVWKTNRTCLYRTLVCIEQLSPSNLR